MIWVAILAIVANALWLVGVASITIGYLAPHLQGAIMSVLNLIAGEGSDRELFKSNNGVVTPLILAGKCRGHWSIWSRRRGIRCRSRFVKSATCC